MSADDRTTSADDPTCVIYDAAEVVAGPARDDPETGAAPLERIEGGAVACVDGRVARVGPSEKVRREYPPENADVAVDASGKSVVPGFVDPHTHAVFAGDRSGEFEAKLRGKTYQEILSEGGGILRTVRATREASDEHLLETLLARLDVMLDHGSTTVEVKSGYGLDVETELRLLETVAAADERHPVDVVPTYLGAHAVPEGRDADDYVEEVVSEGVPAVADRDLATFCDVFCEEGAFDVAQSRRVLEAGREAGLTPKVHAEEFSRLGGTRLAADLEAASADHLLHATTDDVRALVEAGTAPVLLPGTAFGLGADYADARAFLEAGAPVALATDFNPNCHARSMEFVQTLACVEMGMTSAEALLGATRRAARALESGDRSDGENGSGAGTLREGAPADALVLEAPSYVHLAYRFDTTAVETVIKDGRRVR